MSLESRFWAKVDVRGTGECWPWTAAVDDCGYGILHSRYGETNLKAHRVSVMLDGRDPSGLVVRHTCDNPPCVNPGHLVVGTIAENVADMFAKGRGNRGSRNGLSKMTEADVVLVRVFRYLGVKYQDISEFFLVGENTLADAAKGRTWGHVEVSPILVQVVALTFLGNAGLLDADSSLTMSTCRYGHVLDSANGHTNPNGKTACRTCGRRAAARYRQHLKQKLLIDLAVPA